MVLISGFGRDLNRYKAACWHDWIIRTYNNWLLYPGALQWRTWRAREWGAGGLSKHRSSGRDSALYPYRKVLNCSSTEGLRASNGCGVCRRTANLFRPLPNNPQSKLLDMTTGNGFRKGKPIQGIHFYCQLRVLLGSLVQRAGDGPVLAPECPGPERRCGTIGTVRIDIRY